jgi:hypothetical protein
MPVTKWTRHPTFPATNVQAGKDGALGLVRLREWAFGKLIAEGIASGETIKSSAPAVITGGDLTAPGHVTVDFRTGEVSFLARGAGGTLLFPVNSKGKLQGIALNIVVEGRRATGPNNMSQTTLTGTTFGINAPDAKSYEMDTTLTFSPAMSPVKIFESVPTGTDHVVVSSHGRIPDDLPKDTDANLSMLIAGDTPDNQKRRLDLTNVEAAFTPLKKKLTKDAVIWLGSCTMGNNTAFCEKAAIAAGRTIVAPTAFCPLRKYPKNKIDVLDGQAMVKVFGPDGKIMRVSDFCAKQVAHKFTVPI